MKEKEKRGEQAERQGWMERKRKKVGGFKG